MIETLQQKPSQLAVMQKVFPARPDPTRPGPARPAGMGQVGAAGRAVPNLNLRLQKWNCYMKANVYDWNKIVNACITLSLAPQTPRFAFLGEPQQHDDLAVVNRTSANVRTSLNKVQVVQKSLTAFSGRSGGLHI